MPACYICNSRLTKSNKSKEHIFLNAVGGRLQSKNLLCHNCNSKFGQKCDSDLSKQLNVWANLLNIKRQRGKPQDILLEALHTEDKIRIQPGGTLRSAGPPDVVIDEKGNNFSIIANDQKQAINILEGLKRKYPKLDMEKARNDLQEIKKPIKASIKYHIGGNSASRSICKTAINFYLLNNGNKNYINHLIPFLKNEEDFNVVCFYYPDQEIIDYDNNSEILHSIIIIGDNQNKIIYAYVEYFSIYKFIVLMSDNYNGDNFSISYFYNVVTQKTVKKSFQLNLSLNKIKEIVTMKSVDTNQIKENIARTNKLVTQKNRDVLYSKISSDAVRKELKMFPKGTTITNKLARSIADNIANSVVENLRQKQLFCFQAELGDQK